MAIVLPDSSLPYILFQRTDYLVLPKKASVQSSLHAQQPDADRHCDLV